MNYSSRLIILFALLTLFLPYQSAKAQTQSLSVTPPLFQISVAPGDVWQSSIQVVNTNDYPLTVYAEVVNFAAAGESGQGRFIPLVGEDPDASTLASWIQIAEGPHVIPAQETASLSFFLDVPDNPSPGGHFASILISTEPPKETNEKLAVITSQSVATLFFVRIEGDAVENAQIREFSILDRSIELPEAEFSLRFENKGNVHLQPRGDIVITNMWGAVRGTIPINNQTHFGNVLPNSIRDFRFTWKGDRTLADIGRYKAVVTLGYGEDGVKSLSQVAYFWIIPVRAALITLFVIALTLAVIVYGIRSYVRRMLMLAGVDPELDRVERRRMRRTRSEMEVPTYTQVTLPIRTGVLDLRSRISTANETYGMVHTVITFVWSYKKFFIPLAILIVLFMLFVSYVNRVSVGTTEYEVTIDEGDRVEVLRGEDIESVVK